jgi:hypothetical protein
MMISQPALICLNATWQRLMRKSARDMEPAVAQALQPHVQEPDLAGAIHDAAGAATEQSLMAAAVGGESRAPEAREVRQVSSDRVDVSTPLAANERRARAAALRAMALGRERRFDAARVAFAEAAGLDPLLDLTRTTPICRQDASAMRRSCARGCRARFARSQCGRGRRPCSAGNTD